MITLQNNPVEWGLLTYELQDAHEHLGDLIIEMSKDGAIDAADFRVHLGHVFSHLNRSWHSRNRTDDGNDSTFAEESKFPKDLIPC